MRELVITSWWKYRIFLKIHHQTSLIQYYSFRIIIVELPPMIWYYNFIINKIIGHRYNINKDMSWEDIKKKLPVGETPQEDERRKEYWRRIDMNNNGYLSLAEVDKGLRDIIKIPQLFELKPVIIRAFTAAKTTLKASNPHGDDYVSQAEFKFLLIYLRQYYQYWDVFAKIDTSKDRRVSAKEFVAAIPTLQRYGVKISNANDAFKEIDANHGGFVLFEQFTHWAIRKHFDFHKA